LYLAQIGTTNSKPGATNSKAAETKSKEIDRKSKQKTTKTKLDFLPQIEPFQGVALTFGARRHEVERAPSIARGDATSLRVDLKSCCSCQLRAKSLRRACRAAPGLAPLAGRKGCRQYRSSEGYSTVF
jgi:hypothetical protein